MKKRLLFALALPVLVLNLFTGSQNVHTYSSGAPTGVTGAPGEGTCNNCHSNTLHRAATTNLKLTLTTSTGTVVTQYSPGVIYNVSLVCTPSGTPATKYGFEVKAVDSTGSDFGTLSAGSGQRSLSGPPTYLTHSNTLSSGTIKFKWKAPATSGGKVTFYAMVLNGTQRSGNLYQNSFVVSPAPVAVAEKSITATEFTIFPNPAINFTSAKFALPAASKVEMGLYSLTGQKVANLHSDSYEAGEHTVKLDLPAGLSAGNYIINIVTGNNTISRRLVIQ